MVVEVVALRCCNCPIAAKHSCLIPVHISYPCTYVTQTRFPSHFHSTYFCSSYRCRSPYHKRRHIRPSGQGRLARDRIWGGAGGARSRTDPLEVSRLRPIVSCDLCYLDTQVWGSKTSLKCPQLLLVYLEQWTSHIAPLVFFLCATVGSFIFLNIRKDRPYSNFLNLLQYVGRSVLGKIPERHKKYTGQVWPYFTALLKLFFLGVCLFFKKEFARKKWKPVIPTISIRTFAKLCREFKSGSKR